MHEAGPIVAGAKFWGDIHCGLQVIDNLFPDLLE
jgi:hypothetical protein